MAYISKDNLNSELKQDIAKIEELSSEINSLKQEVEKGTSLTFDDLSLEQIDLIRGEQGLQGIQGVKGEVGDVNIVHYDSNGETPFKVKLFTGETKIVSDGMWSIDYSHVGFTKVFGVFPVAIHNSNTNGDTPTGATLIGYSNTSANGKSLKGTAAGLLVGMVLANSNPNETRIQVLVIGY